VLALQGLLKIRFLGTETHAQRYLSPNDWMRLVMGRSTNHRTYDSYRASYARRSRHPLYECPDGSDYQSTLGRNTETALGVQWRKVASDGLNGGAIDIVDITVMPEALGIGLPLFSDAYNGPMRLMGTTVYPNGATRLVYNTSPD
jgi:hypothetical protein